MQSLIDWLTSKWSIRATGSAASAGLLVLRIGLGLMMAFSHGWGKLTSYGELSAKFPDPLGVGSAFSLALAVFAEFFCSLALTFGLLTRAAVLPLIVTMLVAAFVIHVDDPWAKQEFALLYLIPYVAILFAGPGRYSVDALFGNRAA